MVNIFKTALCVLALILILAGVCGCANEQTVEVVSVSSVGPPVPAGPTVEIILENTGEEPVTELTATLKLEKSYDFNFEVTDSSPLLPGESSGRTKTLLGPGSNIGSDETYSLKISGKLQSGKNFSYTKKVRIEFIVS